MVRKIDTADFRRATRSTPRDVNRQILMNLVWEHQPISRADLARRMRVGRGMVTSLVTELLEEGALYEGATGASSRGRKPKLLHVRVHDRCVVAVDVRFSRTYLMLGDFGGRQIGFETVETRPSPADLVSDLAERIGRMLDVHGVRDDCEGIGVVVPGMVDRRTGRVLSSPQLEWQDVEIRDALASATGLPVHIENAAVGCAFAHMWLGPRGNSDTRNFVYVTVSDGVGAGVVVNGEIVRGHDHTAGEFGHLLLSVDGPRCSCGRTGCLEAYTSNLATLSRYLDLDLSRAGDRARLRESTFTVEDLIARARSGDAEARWALDETARYLGLGLVGIIHALNPARIIVGGEIAEAWDLVEPAIRERIKERALTPPAALTPLVPDPGWNHPRLRGALALIIAPVFAVPRLG